MNSSSGVSLPELLHGDVVAACAGLIGCVIARRLAGADGTQRILRARIVEAEAYHQCEAGCHAYRGRTPRNAVMFAPPGSLYVYFTYGMWHCANVVCEAEGTAAAVLLRAAALLPGADGADGVAESAPPLRLSGPGLLCRGLELTREHSGISVLGYSDDGLPPSAIGAPAAVWLYRPPDWAPPPLSWTTRIGFSFPDTRLWRCFATGHPAVSPGRPGALRKLKRRA